MQRENFFIIVRTTLKKMFQRKNNDAQLKTLKCQDMTVIDNDCNLHLPSARIKTANMNTIYVAGNLFTPPTSVCEISEQIPNNMVLLIDPVMVDRQGIGRIHVSGPISYPATLGEPLVLTSTDWALSFESNTIPTLLQDNKLFVLPTSYPCFLENWVAYVKVNVSLTIDASVVDFDMSAVNNLFSIQIYKNTSLTPLSVSNSRSIIIPGPDVTEQFTITLCDIVSVSPGEDLSVVVTFDCPGLVSLTRPQIVGSATESYATFNILTFQTI
jgi:hypothetical protein